MPARKETGTIIYENQKFHTVSRVCENLRVLLVE